MNFLELPPRRERRPAFAHAAILTVFTLTLLGFGVATDKITGKALVADALGFSVIFLAASYFLVALPRIWKQGQGTAVDGWAAPTFIVLIICYLYFAFRSFFIQPTATGLAVLAQLLVMICLLCRAS